MSVSIGTYDEDELGRMPRNLRKPLEVRAKLKAGAGVKSLPKIKRAVRNPPALPLKPQAKPAIVQQKPQMSIMPVSQQPPAIEPGEAQIKAETERVFKSLVSKMPPQEQARIAALFQKDKAAAELDPKVKALIAQTQSQVAARFKVQPTPIARAAAAPVGAVRSTIKK